MPGPRFGFVKLLALSGSHCTKWADEQHRPAGFESRLVLDLPLPFIPTLIGLRAFDHVSSRVWWEAATNKQTHARTHIKTYMHIHVYHHHHHHIALVARISLTLSCHSSLSFIALGRSSGQHPVSSHSCWMYVRAGRPAFARPCVGIHKSTSLMSSSSFFSSRFVSVHVVHPYSSIDVTAAWKKLRFILSVRSDFHIIDSLLIAVHAFVNLVSMSLYIYKYIHIHININTHICTHIHAHWCTPHSLKFQDWRLTIRFVKCHTMESGRGQGKLCYVFFFLSDSILRLFHFYPMLSCWCNSLNKKAQKELYEGR